MRRKPGARLLSAFALSPYGIDGNYSPMIQGNLLKTMPEMLLEQRVLIVDEQKEVNSEMEAFLLNRGFLVQAAGDLSRASRAVMDDDYSTIIVNIDTSRTNSLRQLRELREVTDAIIIVSTHNPDEYDRVLCLEMAVDDYLVRPYSARELLARIHANARRYAQAMHLKGNKDPLSAAQTDDSYNVALNSAKASRPGKLSLPGLVFNGDGTDLTTTDGREIPLTKLEHALFRLLVVNSDREVTVEDISRQIYRGPCTDGNRSKLTMLVHRLRNKLKKYALRERLIVCSHNKGYRFNATLEKVA